MRRICCGAARHQPCGLAHCVREETYNVGLARKVAKKEGHAVEVKLLPSVELRAHV